MHFPSWDYRVEAIPTIWGTCAVVYRGVSYVPEVDRYAYSWTTWNYNSVPLLPPEICAVNGVGYFRVELYGTLYTGWVVGRVRGESITLFGTARADLTVIG